MIPIDYPLIPNVPRDIPTTIERPNSRRIFIRRIITRNPMSLNPKIPYTTDYD